MKNRFRERGQHGGGGPFGWFLASLLIAGQACTTYSTAVQRVEVRSDPLGVDIYQRTTSGDTFIGRTPLVHENTIRTRSRSKAILWVPFLGGTAMFIGGLAANSDGTAIVGVLITAITAGIAGGTRRGYDDRVIASTWQLVGKFAPTSEAAALDMQDASEPYTANFTFPQGIARAAAERQHAAANQAQAAEAERHREAAVKAEAARQGARRAEWLRTHPEEAAREAEDRAQKAQEQADAKREEAAERRELQREEEADRRVRSARASRCVSQCLKKMTPCLNRARTTARTSNSYCDTRDTQQYANCCFENGRREAAACSSMQRDCVAFCRDGPDFEDRDIDQFFGSF